MGMRSPGSPCNKCSKHELRTCPYFNLLNPNPRCQQWKEFANRTYQQIRKELRQKYKNKQRDKK